MVGVGAWRRLWSHTTSTPHPASLSLLIKLTKRGFQNYLGAIFSELQTKHPWQNNHTMWVVESVSPKVMRLKEVAKAPFWKGKMPGEDAECHLAGWRLWGWLGEGLSHVKYIYVLWIYIYVCVYIYAIYIHYIYNFLKWATQVFKRIAG